jgi:hypothetical protein
MKKFNDPIEQAFAAFAARQNRTRWLEPVFGALGVLLYWYFLR